MNTQHYSNIKKFLKQDRRPGVGLSTSQMWGPKVPTRSALSACRHAKTGSASTNITSCTVVTFHRPAGQVWDVSIDGAQLMLFWGPVSK